MTSKGVSDLINKPQELMGEHTTRSLPSELRDLNCSDPSICENNNKKACYQWFLSICMNQRHYQQMLDDTEYVKQIFKSIKGSFYQAINHVETTTEADQELKPGPYRQERSADSTFGKYRSNMDSNELQFVAQALELQVNKWGKAGNDTRHKRFGVDTLILGTGVLANRNSIKTIQKNIKKIHEDNKRQDRQINTLAKLFNKLLFRVRQHDNFLHKLDARVIKIEHDLLNLLELSHYNSYTTYTLRDANYVLTRLLTGLTTVQQNAESIYTFLRVMSTHKLDPTVIPIPELVDMMQEVEEDIKESPRLALPIPIDEVEEYYQIIRISTVITEDTLIILLSIPLTDISLQMNLYKAHNLPAVHPELGLAATYQLEGEYLAIGQDGHYAALPDKSDVQICVLSRGGLCRMNQALYPMDRVQWCILALFQDDQENISKICKFDLSQSTGNLAHSLGGYLWAISATATEKLQVRCLKKTYIVIIGPPLHLVFIGDGCEGYSPSIAITAITPIGNKLGRQTFFIGFNSLYQANPLIGIWANMGIDFIDEEQAEKLAITFTEIKGINMEKFKIQIQDLEKDTFEMPSGLILGVMVASVIAILVTIAIFICNMINKHLSDKGVSWPLYASMSVYAMNTFASTALQGLSPFELVFARKPRQLTGFEIHRPEYREFFQILMSKAKMYRDMDMEWRTLQALELRNRNEMLKNIEVFEENDLVYLLAQHSSSLQTNAQKFRQDYVGPLAIDTKIDETHYLLKYVQGRTLKGDYHINWIKHAAEITPTGIASMFTQLCQQAGLPITKSQIEAALTNCRLENKI